ncbi:hypothetical protein G7Z17_g6719 [Cylindrodendrum hubeiense]|uniref:Uncharacterized protein n=1 Tax=Cylindrodendrum hubeiense TaxID=595255 RepID=A0A9P5H9B7_9HYPO|nr:hypothetical protein G7Z17_g6719 [Cylindrodendrum hubeiense]
MAPVNGSAKPRRHGGSKLAQPSKPVVPAIPLPHVKRQAAAAAAASTSVNSPPPADSRSETKLTNGSATAKIKKDAKASVAAAAAAAVRPAAKLGNDSQPANGPETNDGAVDANHRDLSVASISEQASTSELDDAPKVASTPDHIDQPTVAPKATVHAQAPNDIPEKPNGVATKNEMKPHPADHPTAKHPTKFRPPPAVSPSRYQMPPSFQPANRPLAMTANGDLPRAHRPHVPNGPHMHQPHPSNGSIHFGTFHGSTSSSPAPPHSGGIAPPPGMPGPDGRPPYMGHGVNGFPPMMPYGGDMIPATTFDNYGRPSMAYGPMDSYPPYGNNFGPSTPHSFHDSQTSHPEDNGMYGQYQSGPVRNGVTGHGEDSPNHPGRMFGGPEYPRMMPNHGPPPHMMPTTDEADGLVGHLQQQFRAPEFADCVLELRYTDDRAPPVRLPGHRILLSRSMELAGLLAKQSSQPSPGFPSLPTITLETKSKWIRSDSFYLAVQRLYGLPLFSIPPSPAGAKQGDVADFGSTTERLDFALSYAAAGHLLGWEAVTRRGCEIAFQLINWQTVERALEFALEDHIDMGSYDTYKYGNGSRGILNEIVNFIINNLPSNFILDTSIADPEKFRRLPSYPTPPATPMVQKHSPPAIARGTSLHMGRNRRSQQITGIQFGDLSLAEGKNSVAENPEASQLGQPPSHAIISRILLNLPFTHLKIALESPASNNANRWIDLENRHRIIKDAVAERERRRLQAVDAISGGRVAGWESMLKQLSTPEPRYFDQWVAPLGWLEDFLPYGNPEGPTLARMWLCSKDPQNGTTAEYP